MITLDRRSGSFELLPLFPRGTAELDTLPFGDASFLGNGPDDTPVFVGVERKAIQDLVSSIETGRLQGHQIPGLCSSYNRVYLIVEGLWRPGKSGLLETWGRGGWQPLNHGRRQYPSKLILNVLNTLQVFLGIIILYSSNQAHTVQLVVNLAEWWGRPWSSHRGHLGFAVEPHPVCLTPTRPSLVQRMAKELPGVGWDRSKAVGDHFATPVSMVLSPKEEWEQIPGVGKITAERVVNALRGIK